MKVLLAILLFYLYGNGILRFVWIVNTINREKNVLVAVIYQFENSNWTCLSLLSFRLTNKIKKKLKIMVLLIEFIATVFFTSILSIQSACVLKTNQWKIKRTQVFPSFFNCQNEWAKNRARDWCVCKHFLDFLEL